MDFRIELEFIKFLQISESNWADPLHSHENSYQISIPISGKLITTLNQSDYVLNNGHAIVTNPSSTHSHQFEKGQNKMLLIGLNRCSLNEWLMENKGLNGEVLFEENQLILTNQLLSKIRSWSSAWLFNEDPLYQNYIEDEIFSYFSQLLIGSHSSKSRAVYSDNFQLNQVLDYIHTSYSENINIEQLAAVANQSKYHFIRSFKKATNYPPGLYIQCLRIENAQRLILTTKKTITEISYEVGFSNPSQFYKIFNKLVGIPPKKYRIKNSI
ncbi:AraC family transcriptional regulator [Peribacillus butanolivorans]|uniref:helix-turn-helix domain-containing protein n=1 Tax=Peribacillus butanolivorans TaxID=421767 RepID=UPI003D2E4E70